MKLLLSLGLGGEVGQQQGSSWSTPAFPAAETGAWANLKYASFSAMVFSVLPSSSLPCSGSPQRSTLLPVEVLHLNSRNKSLIRVSLGRPTEH